MKVLLYDFRWLDEHNCEFQASADNRFGRKKIKIGDRLSIEVKSREKRGKFKFILIPYRQMRMVKT